MQTLGRKTVPFKAGCRMLGLRREPLENPKAGRYVNKVKIVFVATTIAAIALVACLVLLSITSSQVARRLPIEKIYEETTLRSEVNETESSNATDAQPLKYLIISPRRPKAIDLQTPYPWRRIPTAYSDRFAQLEGYRQPRRVHTVDDIMRYIRAERRPPPLPKIPPPSQPAVKLAGLYFLTPPNDDMDTSASMSRPSFVMDPLNRYKPQHPAEINLLASSAPSPVETGPRFSTRGRPGPPSLYTEAVFHGLNTPVSDRRKAIVTDTAEETDDTNQDEMDQSSSTDDHRTHHYESDEEGSYEEVNDSSAPDSPSTSTTEFPSSSKANHVKREDSYTPTTVASKTLPKEAVSVSDWNQGRKRNTKKTAAAKEDKVTSDGGEIVRSIEYSFTLPEVAANTPGYKDKIYKLDSFPVKMPEALMESGYLAGKVGDFGQVNVQFSNSQKSTPSPQRGQERRQSTRTTTPKTISITAPSHSQNKAYTRRNKEPPKENNVVHYKISEPKDNAVQFVPTTKEAPVKYTAPQVKYTTPPAKYTAPQIKYTSPPVKEKPVIEYNLPVVAAIQQEVDDKLEDSRKYETPTQKTAVNLIEPEKPKPTDRTRNILRTNPRAKLRDAIPRTTESPRQERPTPRVQSTTPNSYDIETTKRPPRRRGRPTVQSKVMTRTQIKKISTVEHENDDGPIKQKVSSFVKVSDESEYPNTFSHEINSEPDFRSPSYKPISKYNPPRESYSVNEFDYTTDSPKSEYTTDPIVFIVPKRIIKPSPIKVKTTTENYRDINNNYQEIPLREYESPVNYKEVDIITERVRETLPPPNVHEEVEEEELIPSTTENPVVSSSRASILLGNLGELFRSVAYPKGEEPNGNDEKDTHVANSFSKYSSVIRQPVSTTVAPKRKLPDPPKKTVDDSLSRSINDFLPMQYSYQPTNEPEEDEQFQEEVEEDFSPQDSSEFGTAETPVTTSLPRVRIFRQQKHKIEQSRQPSGDQSWYEENRRSDSVYEEEYQIADGEITSDEKGAELTTEQTDTSLDER